MLTQVEPVRSSPNVSIARLPMQWKWIHGCVSVDSVKNHLIVVINGLKVDDKTFPIVEGTTPPTSLADRLQILKATPWQGIWANVVG